MPSTHFAAGWMRVPFLPVPKADLEQANLTLPILVNGILTSYTILHGVTNTTMNISRRLFGLDVGTK